MHHPTHLLAVLAALALAPAALATPHRHAPAVAAAATATPGKTATARYPADAALRTAMARVRAAVGALERARKDRAAPAQVRALSTELDAQVMRVFAECRLEPQADASLHVILGMILKASRAMRDTPGDFTPVAAMQRALADYARLFDDPAARAAAARQGRSERLPAVGDNGAKRQG